MGNKISILLTVSLSFVLIATLYAQDNTKVGLPEGAIARLGKGGISVMRFSPDGNRLAVGTSVGVWLYDVKTGNTKALIPSITRQIDKKIKNIYGEHNWIGDSVSYVNCLAFSPDNRILAVGEKDNFVVQLWDLETDIEKSTLPATHHQNKAYAIAFSEDSKTLITPHYFGEIIHWDVSTGNRSFFKNSSPSHSYDRIAITEDGKTFVSGDRKDGEIRLWDAYTGRQLTQFKAKTPFGTSQHEPKPQKGVKVLALSPDGKAVASAHDDSTVRLWDIASSTETVTFNGHKERVNSIVFSPDSKLLVSGSNDETIIFWDVVKKQKITTLTGHDGSVQAVTFSPNGEILASGSIDGTIRFWDVKTKQEMSIFASGHTKNIISMAFTEDDNMLATAAENGTVEIWNINTRKLFPKPSIAYHDKTEAAAFSQDARMFVSHGSETTVRSNEGGTGTSWLPKRETRISVLPTGDELLKLQENAESYAFSPDSKLLATYINDSPTLYGMQILETDTWKELFFIKKRISFAESLLFSPNGKLLASYGIHTKTMVWDVTTQTEITPHDIKNATGIAFSPDSTILANGNHEGIVLWNITPAGLQELGPINNSHRAFSKGLIFSPDGKTVIDSSSSGRNDVIRLWDVDSGLNLDILSGHTWSIPSLIFSHDGKILASGSGDGTVLLWDWETVLSNARQTKEFDR